MYTILILKNGYFYDYHTCDDFLDAIFMFDEFIRVYIPNLYTLIKECQKQNNPNKLRRMLGPHSNEDKTMINALFTNDDYIIECYSDMICVSSSTKGEQEKFSMFLLGTSNHYLQQMKEAFDTA
jgi:hypothetical protein